MSELKVNGYTFKNKQDLDRFLADLDERTRTEWGRPLLGKSRIVEFLRERGIDFENVKTEMGLTFEERMSGKSVVEILKERKEELERTWRERRKEVVLYGQK